EGVPVDRIGWLRGDDRVVVSMRGPKIVALVDERGDGYTRSLGGRSRWRSADGKLLAEREGRLVDFSGTSLPRPDRVVLRREDGTLEIDDRDGRVVASFRAPTGYRPVAAEF